VSGYNIADLVYQLLCLLFLILIIVGTVSLFRSIKHRKTRLDIMEKKMDDLHELIKRGKN
jgi:TRAP-type C4-dicarboxylate transport system permease small subunit